MNSGDNIGTISKDGHLGDFAHPWHLHRATKQNKLFSTFQLLQSINKSNLFKLSIHWFTLKNKWNICSPIPYCIPDATTYVENWELFWKSWINMNFTLLKLLTWSVYLTINSVYNCLILHTFSTKMEKLLSPKASCLQFCLIWPQVSPNWYDHGSWGVLFFSCSAHL